MHMDNYKITRLKRYHTDEELLEYLRRVADANNGNVTQSIYTEYRLNVDSTIADATTICRQLGWNKALTLVGVNLNKFQNNSKISEIDLLEEILRLWTVLGRQPTTTDLKNGLSKFPRNRYSNVFGSWYDTLNKFIEWVNAENIEPVLQTQSADNKHTTTRDINLRLRFKVLQRDNFKCCSCGTSPATNSTVNLHVDHIIPWSKGGETVLDNLQTLCQDCNLGKSDLD